MTEQTMSNKEERRAFWKDVAVLLGIALLYRLMFILAMPRVVDSPDAVLYIRLAESFAEGDWFVWHARLPILHSLLGALAYQVIGNMEWACRMVSFAASTLLIVPVYSLAYTLHGRRPARLMALVVAVWPWLADYAGRVTPEALAVFLWFSGIVTIVYAVRKGGVWMFLAPLMWFGLNLARPEGIVLMVAAPIGIWLILCMKSEQAKLRRLVPYVIMVTLMLIAYGFYAKQSQGAFTINPRIESGTSSHLLSNWKAIAHAAIRIPSDVLPIMIGPYFLIFCGVGIFHATKTGTVPSEERARENTGTDASEARYERRRVCPWYFYFQPKRDIRLELFVLYLALGQSACAALSTFPAPRYMMTVVVAAMLWASRGMAIVACKAEDMPKHQWLKWAPIAGALFIMLSHTGVTVLSEYVGRLPREPREYKIAGQWMKENLEPALLLCRKPEIGFYADMETTGPAPDDSVESVIERARAVGARYLIVDERYTIQIAPGLKPLLDPANAPPSLRLLSADLSPYEQGRVVIYEVLDNPPGRDGEQ